MRRLLLLLCAVTVLAVPPCAGAWSPDSVTVAQLNQFFAGARGRSDARLAKEIAAFALTERVSAAQFAQWQAALPGPRSLAALIALVDAAVQLAPPPSTVLAAAAPDPTTQSAILAQAKDYVTRTLARLPDFSALRTTRHFIDTPLSKNDTAALRFTGLSSARVSFSNGEETHGVEKMDIPFAAGAAPGLVTAGEFGPILSVVLDDSAHGSVQWADWEQGPQGRLAVFRYSVPQPHSSYLLSLTQGFREINLFPAYFGEIAIDPATGAVFRISIFTNSLRAQNVLESAMVVEYAPVQLGGKSYVCPVRGVALIQSLVSTPRGGTAPETELNDVAFTDYHLLRGDVRILPGPQ